MVGGDGHLGLSCSYMNFISKKSNKDKDQFLVDPINIHTHSHSNAIIDMFDGKQVGSSSWDFSLVTSRKHCNIRMKYKCATQVGGELEF